jgi:hypothetical protein
MASTEAQSRMPIIIAVVAVIAIVAAGGGVYYWKFMRAVPADETAATAEPAETSAPEMPVEPVVVHAPESPMPPPDPESQPEEIPATVATDAPPPEAAAPVAPPPAPVAAPPAPPPPSGLQPEIAARIGTMLRQGQEYKQQLQYDKAIATAENVLLIDPGNRAAKRLMQEARDGQQAALSSIEID